MMVVVVIMTKTIKTVKTEETMMIEASSLPYKSQQYKIFWWYKKQMSTHVKQINK